MISDGYICCFTGHRNILAKHQHGLADLIDNILEKLIKNGVTVFRTGGAIGFDTAVALKVIEKKNKYPQIQLHLMLPCKNQSEKWNDYCKQTYLYTLEKADKITYTSEIYARGCMLKRNRELVNGSHYCIAYCVSDTGGTAYTLDYAKKHNVRTLNIAKLL